jgi:hypothetical protein
MTLSSEMESALEQGVGVTARVVTIDVLDDVWRFSDAPFNSKAAGAFDMRVLAFGDIKYEPSDIGGAPPTITVSIDIDDSDRMIRQFHEGPAGPISQARAMPVTIRRANTTVEPAGWAPEFTGLVENVDWPDAANPFKARLYCRVADRVLDLTTPKPGWRITLANFPQAESAALGKTAPLLYGVHNSAGYSQKGFLPLLKVDQVAFKYLVCAGRAKGISTVYVGGVAAPSADWELLYPLVRGRRYTLIQFASDPGADAVITCDARGYETVGDGSGALIQNPADAIAHYFSNFVFADWMNGDWFATSDRLSSSHLDEAAEFFTQRSYRASRYIGDAEEADQELGRWLESFGAYCWWNELGQLCLKVDNLNDTDVYAGARLYHPAGWSLVNEDTDRVIASTTVNYIMDSTSGSFQQTLNTRLPNVEGEAAMEIEQPWMVSE